MKLLDLSSGASYFKSPDFAITAAINALQTGNTTYGPTEGLLALRTALAEKYNSVDRAFNSDNIIVTPGTKQALYNLLTVLLREDDEVIIPTPAWFGFHSLLQYSKGTLVSYPTSLSDGYAISPQALQKVLNSRSRILLLTNPGNPTGSLYSKKELEALLSVTANFPDLYIISDEIYDLDSYGKSFTSIFSCEGASEERTVVVNGFSKTFAMSGWRIGYIAGAKELIKQCADFQGSTLSGVSMFIQEAAMATIQNQREALGPMLAVLKEHRSIMEQGLAAIPEVKFFLPEGAYYFFPDFSYYFGRTTPSGKVIRTSFDLCKYLSDDYKLKLSPGDQFGAPAHARMSFAVEKSVLQDALSRLRQALHSLSPRN